MKIEVREDQIPVLKQALVHEQRRITKELEQLKDSSEHAYVNEGLLFVVMNEKKKLLSEQEAIRAIQKQLTP